MVLRLLWALHLRVCAYSLCSLCPGAPWLLRGVAALGSPCHCECMLMEFRAQCRPDCFYAAQGQPSRMMYPDAL